MRYTARVLVDNPEVDVENDTYRGRVSVLLTEFDGPEDESQALIEYAAVLHRNNGIPAKEDNGRWVFHPWHKIISIGLEGER
jgi:hypothetical protein